MGTILAADAGGDPVVATHANNVQFADFILSGYAQYTLTYTLGGVFPAHSQAYYDGMLGDAANAVGLGIYFLSHVNSSAAALVLIAAIAMAIAAHSTVEKV